MAIDTFLNLAPRIKGESKDTHHRDDIDVVSWQWGIRQAGTVSPTSGRKHQKVETKHLTFKKTVDAASHALLNACVNSKILPDGLITVRKAGQHPLEYIYLRMKNVQVISVDFDDNDGQAELMQEVVVLAFDEVQFAYIQQKDDGSGDAERAAGWRLKNEALGAGDRS